MKAFRMDGPGSAAVVDIPEAALQQGEALLRVKMVGLCGTDSIRFVDRTRWWSFRGFRVTKLQRKS